MLTRSGVYTVYYRNLDSGGYIEESVKLTGCSSFTHAEHLFNEKFKKHNVSIHKITAELLEG